MRSSAASPARWLAFALLAIAAVLFLAPVAWMVLTSVKPAEQAASESIRLLPDPPSSLPMHAMRNYVGEFNQDGSLKEAGVLTDGTVDFGLALRNSLVVALLSVLGMVLSSAMVAYGFARIPFRASKPLFGLLLATMMIPFPVLMTPLFVIFSKVGWTGTLLPLWVPAWFGGAFNIFLLRQFMRQIPAELDEAARIDGCSHWGVFWRIILPLCRPALLVVGLFHFTYVWNDFLGPLIFCTSRDQFTLALSLNLYQSKSGNTPWNLLMAASTMVVAPVLLLFLVAQRTFVEGLGSGGVKD